MIQLQHLGEKRLGGLWGRTEETEGPRKKGKRKQKKVSSLVHFVCARAL